LDKGELRGAFKKAGLSVPDSKLNQFFTEVDRNNDVSPGICFRCDYETDFINRDISLLQNGGT
jgi:hypothetical protein